MLSDVKTAYTFTPTLNLLLSIRSSTPKLFLSPNPFFLVELNRKHNLESVKDFFDLGQLLKVNCYLGR